MSDTHETDFACVRHRRSLPAHAHDAPFTHNPARIPGIDPPKWFHTRSNSTPLVARAWQALSKTIENRARTKVGQHVFDRTKSQVRNASGRGTRGLLAHPARILLSYAHHTPHVV